MIFSSTMINCGRLQIFFKYQSLIGRPKFWPSSLMSVYFIYFDNIKFTKLIGIWSHQYVDWNIASAASEDRGKLIRSTHSIIQIHKIIESRRTTPLILSNAKSFSFSFIFYFLSHLGWLTRPTWFRGFIWFENSNFF